MIISINNVAFPVSYGSSTIKDKSFNTKTTPNGTLLKRLNYEKWQTEQEWEGWIPLETQQAFYEMVELGLTTTLTIVALDSETGEQVTYTGVTVPSTSLIPSVQYIGAEPMYSGCGATFREV